MVESGAAAMPKKCRRAGRSDERPPRRAEEALVGAIGTRTLNEHRVRAQIGDAHRAVADTRETLKGSSMRATIPILPKRAQARSERLREEHVLKRVAKGEGVVDEIEGKGGGRRAVERREQELVLDHDGADQVAGVLERLSSDRPEGVVWRRDAEGEGVPDDGEAGEDEAEDEEGVAVRRSNADEGLLPGEREVEGDPGCRAPNTAADEEVAKMLLRERDVLTKRHHGGRRIRADGVGQITEIRLEKGDERGGEVRRRRGGGMVHEGTKSAKDC